MSGASEHKRYDWRDQELECLHRMVRDFELEVRGRRQRRNREEHAEGSASVRGSLREASRQSGSHRSRDWSREYADRDSVSLEGQRPRNVALDAMSRALHKAARSPSWKRLNGH